MFNFFGDFCILHKAGFVALLVDKQTKRPVDVRDFVLVWKLHLSAFVKFSTRVFSKCLYFYCNALCSSQPLLGGHCTWIQGSSAKHVPTWLHCISDHQEHHQHHQDHCDHQGHHSDTVMTVVTVMA